MTDEEFLALIEAFLVRNRLSATTFGIWAMNDPKFVFAVRKGRPCYAKTMVRVRRYMEQYDAKQRAKLAKSGAQ